MHTTALLALQAMAVESVVGLSPDAKWILTALGTGVLMLAMFLSRITFALLPSAKEALLGIAKLPAAVDGVKDELAAVKTGMAQELRETRIAVGVLKVEMIGELDKLGDGFSGLAAEIRDHRVSDMAKASAAALAIAQATLPDNPSPDFSEIVDEPSSSSRYAPAPRVPRPRPASSPALLESGARSARPRGNT